MSRLEGFVRWLRLMEAYALEIVLAVMFFVGLYKFVLNELTH